MAASIRSSTKAAVATAQNVTITTPSGAAQGDRLYAFLLADDSTSAWTANVPADWSAVEEQTFGGGAPGSGAVFVRTLPSGSPSGSYQFDLAGGVNKQVHGILVCVNPDGGTFGTTSSSKTTGAAVTSTATAAVTGAAGDSVLLCSWGSTSNRAVTTPPASMTVAQVSDGGASDLAVYTELAVGAGSLTRTLVWASLTDSINLAVFVPVTPAGPTITVQPVADTVILTNETTASFSVTATGTGGLTYDWELETGVSSGVYANVADGSGATWTGQAAASLSATLTAKTLTGRRVRCNVTDTNGTTTTNAVALTIYDGPQLTTFPATNASGVSTATLTSDYVTGTGEFVEVAIVLSDGRVAVTTTVTA